MPASPQKHDIKYLAGRALKAGGRKRRKSRLKKKAYKANLKVWNLIPVFKPTVECEW